MRRSVLVIAMVVALLTGAAQAQYGPPYPSGVTQGAAVQPGSLTAPAGSAGTIGQYGVNNVFNPMQPAYGAKGNVRHCNFDGSINSGQATLSSTSAHFTSADASDSIIVYGAGAAGNFTAFPADGTTGTYTLSTGSLSVTFNTAPANGLVMKLYYESGSTWFSETYGTGDGSTKTFAHTAANTPVVSQSMSIAAGPVDLVDMGPADLVTTISSVTSGVATLAGTASTTVSSGGLCAFGTDDTAAIVAAINAAATAGQQLPNAGSAFANGNAQVQLPPGAEFMVATNSGLPIDANNFTVDGQGATIWHAGNATLFPLGGSTITREYNIKNLYVFENSAAQQFAGVNNVSRAYFTNIRDTYGQAGIVVENGSQNNFDIQTIGGRFNLKLMGVQYGHGCDACHIYGTIFDSPWDRAILLGDSSGGQTIADAISGVTIDGALTTVAGIDVGSAHGVDVGALYWEANATNGAGVGVRFGQTIKSGQNNTDSVAIHGSFFNCHSTVNPAIYVQANASGAATVAGVDVSANKFTTCNYGWDVDTLNTSVTTASVRLGPNLYTSMNTANYTFQANPIIFDGGLGADNGSGFVQFLGFPNVNRTSAGVTGYQMQESGNTCMTFSNDGRITGQCGNVLVSNTSTFNTAPTLSASGGTCGTTDVLDTSSTNMAGGFTTGTSGTTSSCVVTWGSGHGAAYPSSNITCQVQDSTDGSVPVYSVNSTALTVTVPNANSKHYFYSCVGH